MRKEREWEEGVSRGRMEDVEEDGRGLKREVGHEGRVGKGKRRVEDEGKRRESREECRRERIMEGSEGWSKEGKGEEEVRNE